MSNVNLNAREVWAGLLMMALALLFGGIASDYPMGEARRLDSGAFPSILSGLLFLLGLAIAISGTRRIDVSGSVAWTWRGLLFIALPPVLFGLLLRELGLVVSLLGVTTLAAFASRRARPAATILLAAILTLFSMGVFVYGLGLPIPLVGRWLGGY